LNFYKAYDYLKIDNLWSMDYKFGDINFVDIRNNKGIYKYIIKLFNRNNQIKKIILDNNVSRLYFGDIGCLAYNFFSKQYKSKEIIYFEEGLSHYYNVYVDLSLKYRCIIPIIKLFVDYMIFIPLFNVKMGYELFTCRGKFPTVIDKRYSIIPFYHESYDEILNLDSKVSDKVNFFLDREIEKISKYNNKRIRVLFLSQPTDILDKFNDIDDERIIFDRFFNDLDIENSLILIKFHPRDSELRKKRIFEIFTNLDIPYIVIFENVVLPIEVLYNKLSLDLIVGYSTSSLFYAKIIMPKVKVVIMYDYLIQYYKETRQLNSFAEKNHREIHDLFDMLFNEQLKK